MNAERNICMQPSNATRAVTPRRTLFECNLARCRRYVRLPNEKETCKQPDQKHCAGGESSRNTDYAVACENASGSILICIWSFVGRRDQYYAEKHKRYDSK